MHGEPIRPQPKHPRGEARLDRKRASKDAAAKQQAVMEAAKRRDSRKCRWPHWSAEERETCRILGIACAHLNHRGMGGDKKLVRTRKDRLITFSIRCHDRFDGRLGPPNRRVVFLTEQGTDGPCAFEEKRSGQWEEIGREVSIGVLMRGSRTATLKE